MHNMPDDLPDDRKMALMQFTTQELILALKGRANDMILAIRTPYTPEGEDKPIPACGYVIGHNGAVEPLIGMMRMLEIELEQTIEEYLENREAL